jgi:hypothetical protein
MGGFRRGAVLFKKCLIGVDGFTTSVAEPIISLKKMALHSTPQNWCIMEKMKAALAFKT